MGFGFKRVRDGFARRPQTDGSRQWHAFTLIEIMMVVAIIGIVMAAGIPSIVSALNKEGIRKATNDLLEACEKARAQAIINGVTAVVDFRPLEGSFSIGAAGSPADSDRADSASLAGEGNPTPPRAFSSFGAKLPDDVKFEMLDVNLAELSMAETAQVRFFPNGTCDEMVAILVSDKGERRVVTLEITTGLPTLFDDPRKLLR